MMNMIEGARRRGPARTPEDGRPLYSQVREALIRRLVDGDWRPGDLIPSESRLALEFGVSQGTLRKALDELALLNLVVRRQGKGTYVATHTPQRALFHFFHLVGDDGSRALPTGRVLAVGRHRAGRAEARRLNLDPGALVVRIERVRDLGGRPAIVETISVPARLFPGLARRRPGELPNTLYQLYEEGFGVTIHQAVERVRAVAARAREARLLCLTAGAPLLEIDRMALALDGTAVEWRLSRCDTARHHYLSTIV